MSKDKKIVIDPETNITHVEYLARHKDYEPEAGGSWHAVEKPIEKTEDEKIREYLVTNKNMPWPKAISPMITKSGLPMGNHDPEPAKQQGRKIVFDEKGHPINPSNQAKYWKLVRKARRMNNRG